MSLCHKFYFSSESYFLDKGFCCDNNIKVQADVTKQFKAFLHFLSKPCISHVLFSSKQWQLSQFHKNSCMTFSRAKSVELNLLRLCMSTY